MVTAHRTSPDGWCVDCSTGDGPVYHPVIAGAPALAAEIGATHRQVDHWTRLGYLTATVPAPGSGRPLIYPAAEVAHARIMARLVATGVAPGAAHVMAQRLELLERLELGAGLTITLEP